jgi:hypothetical protein
MIELWIRISAEISSAAICFLLLYFMIKPYVVTREGRYASLPLGFGFLGVSYLLSAIVYTQLDNPISNLPSRELWIQLVIRAFAFFFLTTNYYFSKKPKKSSRTLWDLIIVALIIICLLIISVILVIPEFSYVDSLDTFVTVVRILGAVCLGYVAIHGFLAYYKDGDSTTIWAPLGFALLAISQVLSAIWSANGNVAALTATLVIRLFGLSLFLFIVYRTFGHGKKKREIP